MQVRILFYCPRCGSVLFRPSISRLFRDHFLRKVGIHPQRCYLCRLRFYLFKPLRLKAFVGALDHVFAGARTPRAHPSTAALETTSNSMVTGVGNLLRR